MAAPELSIVIPAFNEESTVGGVIDGLRDVGRAIASSLEILGCDDGSTDGTAQALEAAALRTPELRIVRNPTNLGIRETMVALYGMARGTWTYFAPADGQIPASALDTMWRVREGAALVVGRRTPRRDPATRVLIAEVYSSALRLFFRLPVHDIDSVKLYNTALQKTLPVHSRSNFFEAEMLIALCRRGAVVREVEIPHRPRIAGRAKGVTPVAAAQAVADVGRFALADLALRVARYDLANRIAGR